MARGQITAPVDPGQAQLARLRQLAAKGSKRTAADVVEAINLLAALLDELAARANGRGA